MFTTKNLSEIFQQIYLIHNISITNSIESLNLIDNYRETLLSTLIGNLNLYPLYSKLIVDIVFPS